jgi:hypothetical protein
MRLRVAMPATAAPSDTLFSELLAALREESAALKAEDAVRLAAAQSRKEHLLRQLSSSTLVATRLP